MKLYEVDQAIEALISQLEPDPETGEIPMDADALLVELNGLQLERERILEYLAKLVLNLRADKAAVKAEEKRLADYKKSLECKENRLMQVLDRECAGKTTNCGIAVVRYRETSHVEVSDTAKAIRWLKRHGHNDCYRIAAPEVNKNDVKKLINTGVSIPGAAIVQERSCSLR